MVAGFESLEGLRVLVPRGGTWGELVSRALREKGANPVISPLIDFAKTSDEDALISAITRLEGGYFDWITATSATVVNVLAHHGAVIHPRTRVAAAGEATEAAFIEAGYEVALTPTGLDTTVNGLLQQWPDSEAPQRILTLRSNVAKPVLTAGLIDRGHDVTQVVAFRTVGVPSSVHTREDVESGRINVLLVASPMIAREVKAQFADRPADTIVACVGQSTCEEALAIGLCQTAAHEESQVRAIVETVESVIEYSDTLD